MLVLFHVSLKKYPLGSIDLEHAMALGGREIELFIKMKELGLLRDRGSVVEVGAQQLDNNFLRMKERLAVLGRLFGKEKLPSLPEPTPSRIAHGDLEHLDAAAPAAREFWLWLGYKYAAIDIDGSPGGIPIDLNYDSLPAEVSGQYDLVTNFGTTEHVTNQLNAFKIIHDLTAHHGIMIHSVPAQGMLNHGLINYNFRFFWRLARSNGYRFIDADFSMSNQRQHLCTDVLDFVVQFNPAAADRLANHEFADGQILAVMEKAFDIPFVSPIDVNTGTTTNIEWLKQRYWTVFEPGAFDRLQNKDG
jgi:hypothetical protein